MFNLKPAEITDKSWVDLLNRQSDFRGCEHNFTNIFIWSTVYNSCIAQRDGFLVVRSRCEDPVYLYPTGSGDLQAVVAAMRDDAHKNGKQLEIIGTTNENQQELDALFPGKFTYEPMRESFDYIYNIESLISLSGKKLHGKRNHINNFVAAYSDWTFEPITPDNLMECFDMNTEWSRENHADSNGGLMQENTAIQKCFDHYAELELEGGLLRLDGKIIAYTIGEVLSSDTYNTHIEKAFSDIQGAYPLINREFAAYVKSIHPEMRYINREEDLGFEGLRHAKLSYQPAILLEKSRAVYQD